MKTKSLTRREALGALGVLGATVAAACGAETPTSPSSGSSSSSASTTPTAGSSSACVVSPAETEGPFASITQVVRSDIRENLPGIPLVLALNVVNVSNGCTPVPNANVEIWQCDSQGRYSEYAQGNYDGRSQTFLRGVQTTDAGGRVTFTTIYPGWYEGRATHIHVEVRMNGRSIKVTQIAFPESVNAQVYTSGTYAAHGQNPTSNSRDMVFADSLSSELAVLSGDASSGFQASFTVGVAI